jgi:hypothetical protein
MALYEGAYLPDRFNRFRHDWCERLKDVDQVFVLLKYHAASALAQARFYADRVVEQYFGGADLDQCGREPRDIGV